MEYLFSLLEHITLTDVFNLALILIGFSVVWPCFLALIKFVYINFIRKPKDLAKLYGKGSWALITGCTSGIGQSMSEQLAAKGFNIILCSRSTDRLEKEAKRLKLRFPSLETKIVQADFSEGNELALYERILKEVEELDISILVNNAGVNYRGKFDDVATAQLLEMTIVNTYPYVLLTKALYKKLANRPKNQRSVVVNVASGLGMFPSPFDGAYSATKAFEIYFS